MTMTLKGVEEVRKLGLTLEKAYKRYVDVTLTFKGVEEVRRGDPDLKKTQNRYVDLQTTQSELGTLVQTIDQYNSVN